MKMQPDELRTSLAQFIGSEEYHQWSVLWPRFILTDGAKFLAENAEAFWLMDVIASHQVKRRVRQEEFQVWKLKVKDSEGKVVADDGNGKVIARQTIEFTDFPLDEIKLYAVYEANYLVIELPSEY